MRRLAEVILALLLMASPALAQSFGATTITQGGNTATVNASGQLTVNCAAGCAAAGDNTTASTALAALNNTIAVSLAGERGATFQLQSGGTLVATITPQCSFDGGTLYNANGYIQDPFTGAVTTTATIASAQATTDYPVMCPQGASNAQVKVTAFTSGTANFVARATVVTWPGLSWGIVTTAAPTYTTGQINALSLDTAGNLRVLTSPSGTQTISGTVTANAGTGNFAENLAQVSGAAVSTAAIGTQKVGITGNTGAAMDAAGQNAVSPANELLSGCQFNTTPTTITTGNMSPVQCDSSGNQLVDLKTALPTGANTIGAVTQASGPWTINETQIGGTAIVANPCWEAIPTLANINLTATGQIITGAAAKQTYICAFNVAVGGADNLALVEGTGTNCGTGTAGMAGGITAATGWNFAANGGLTLGGGIGPVLRTATAADNVCILASSTAQVSGSALYVQN